MPENAKSVRQSFDAMLLYCHSSCNSGRAVSLVVTRNNPDMAKAEQLVELLVGLFLPFTDTLLSCVLSCVKFSSLSTEEGDKHAWYRINRGIYLLTLVMCKVCQGSMHEGP